MAKRITIFLLLTLTFTVRLYADPSLKDSQQRYDQVIKEMEKVRSNLEASNKKEKQILSNLNDLDKSLDKLEKEKAQIIASLQKTNQELAALEKELQVKQAELDESEAKLNSLRDDAGESLRSIQKITAQGWWSFVFNSASISEFWVRSHQIKQFLAADLKALDITIDLYEEHQKKMQALEAKKEEIVKKKSELENTQTKLKDNESQIKKNVNDKKQALTKVNQEKSEYDKALREMEKVSEELGEAIRKLQQKTLDEDGVKKIITMIWPVQGRITSDYGWRMHPILNENRFHTGLDIGASEGKDIRAAADGTVILAGFVQGYGLTTIISHGNKTTTLYGHASKLLTQAGDKVKQNQVIAKVGSTGVSSGPHLHFEIRVNGDPVNPWGWLPVVK